MGESSGEHLGALWEASGMDAGIIWKSFRSQLGLIWEVFGSRLGGGGLEAEEASGTRSEVRSQKSMPLPARTQKFHSNLNFMKRF